MADALASGKPASRTAFRDRLEMVPVEVPPRTVSILATRYRWPTRLASGVCLDRDAN
jgi:hypothetical protein